MVDVRFSLLNEIFPGNSKKKISQPNCKSSCLRVFCTRATLNEFKCIKFPGKELPHNWFSGNFAISLEDYRFSYSGNTSRGEWVLGVGQQLLKTGIANL